ncbi:hypothetical protein NLI96_g4280 [Meripilus lineatus]|uniref:Autophagy-related protein 13 n=1 Tax=Meripilus lineatus TaxID=2056292 RepID=A0AAD5V595_9APHY|nr:hypothetical protein NLI96_g4280 [Physisporinus lineatus]
MFNDAQKADQIAHRFYTKLCLVVNHARATAEPQAQYKPDKWFNLETPDAADLFKEHTRIYKSISTTQPTPSFQVQVLLCVPELGNNQVLTYIASDGSRSPVTPTPAYILLESWSILFTPYHSRDADNRPDVTLATTYKHGIALFRSIFTLLRILPSWKLARRLRRRPGGNRNGGFTIRLRVENATDGHNAQDNNILGFATPVHNLVSLPTDFHEFSPLPHLLGTFAMSVTYLTSPNFESVDRESLLSSRFMSQDEGPEFTPTLLKNQQRDSLSGSPGSLPIRTSLPKSPPSSIADRFVLPPPVHSRTNSLTGGSPRLHNVALPMSRNVSTSGLGVGPSASGFSDTSSRQGPASIGSRGDEQSVSALAARLRRESFGVSRGSDQASAAGGVPIRRPPPQVHPFKSSTLSSGSPSLHSPSPSLRHSPLSAGIGPSLPSRPPHSPISTRGPNPPSPIGSGAPIPVLRPSPTLPPSSLGDRRSFVSAEGVLTSPPALIPGPGDGSPKPSGKRYSSSFGHRYAASGGAGSEGSAGSGVKEGERVTGTSFLSTNTDDDEISAFVQDIDSREPLGRLREQRLGQPSQGRASGTPELPSDRSSPLGRQRTLSVPEPMLTTASAVGERLDEISNHFFATLEGLERQMGRTGERDGSSAGSSTARAPSSGASTVGRRTVLAPLTMSDSRQESPSGSGTSLSRRASGRSATGNGYVGLPPAPFPRPRLASTTSVRSGMSTASGEVLGRMDPEPGDERRSSAR